MIEIIKRLIFNRIFAIALSVAAILCIGYGFGLRVPAVMLSALLFAGGYLLPAKADS